MSLGVTVRKAVWAVLPRRLREPLKLKRAIGRCERDLERTARALRQRPHGMSGRLFVTLTSYPPRFGILHLTLESLRQQTIVPDGILLWIARQDMAKLPRKVRRMEGKGVTICPCDDVRSFKKLVFALEFHPDATLVTADDDVRYPADWLETLVSAVDPREKVVVCHRAHRITLDDNGRIAPYRQWQWEVQDAAARSPSTDLVPVGVGGILYPPNSLSEKVTDRSLYSRLCPMADDLWFYWMARRAGTRHKKVGDRFLSHCWPGSQDVQLWTTNRDGGNDGQVKALVDAFGSPLGQEGSRGNVNSGRRASS